MDPTPVVLLPPLAAVGLAIVTRRVVPSLLAGVVLAAAVLAGWQPVDALTRSVGLLVGVLTDSGSLQVLGFTLLIGALITTTDRIGGVAGFVAGLEDRGWVDGPRRARVLAWLVGLVVFIESNIAILSNGAVSRPVFDRYELSRPKLAYLIDSMAAPVQMLIPLNAWGAYVLGLLAQQETGMDEVTVLAGATLLNFYCIAAIVIAGIVAVTGWSIGEMRRADAEVTRPVSAGSQSPSGVAGEAAGPEDEATPRSDGSPDGPPPRARNLVIPVATLVLGVPVGLFITGGGDITAGSGSTSVLVSTVVALVVAWVLALTEAEPDGRGGTVGMLARAGVDGARGLFGLAVVLWIALALGNATDELGTGAYVAGAVSEAVPTGLLLPLVFVVCAAIAFATGTSWGTFGIMLPVSVPLAVSLGLPVVPFVAATLSGGIWGDHASPISDTSIISAVAADVDLAEHVRTQLPYALLGGAVAALAFAVVGVII